MVQVKKLNQCLKSILLISLFGIQLSCGGNSEETPSDSSSPLLQDEVAFGDEPVQFIDQLGGKHLYLPVENGTALISESQTPDGRLFTTRYLPAGAEVSLEIQHDESGLIRRLQRGDEQLNIRYLGEDRFHIDGIDGNGNPFSNEFEIPTAVGKSGSEDSASTVESLQTRSRNIRALSTPHSLALQCNDGSILTDAEIRMLDISTRNEAPAFSIDAMLGLVANNAVFPINAQQVKTNQWQYYVEQTSLEEAARLDAMNAGINNACAFQSLLSTGLSFFGISFGILDFAGVICNINTALNAYSLALNRQVAGVLSNDSQIRVDIALPDNTARFFYFTPRDVGPSFIYRVNWNNEQYCKAESEVPPMVPLTVYRLPPDAMADPSGDTGSPGENDDGTPPIEVLIPGPPPGDPPPIDPPIVEATDEEFDFVGVWASCTAREFSDGSPLSVKSRIQFDAQGNMTETWARYVGSVCAGELFSRHVYTGSYSIQGFETTSDGLLAALVDFELQDRKITTSFGSTTESECVENPFSDLIGRVNEFLYPSFDQLMDTGFINRIDSICLPILPVAHTSTNRLHFEREAELCSEADLAGNTPRVECLAD